MNSEKVRDIAFVVLGIMMGILFYFNVFIFPPVGLTLEFISLGLAIVFLVAGTVLSLIRIVADDYSEPVRLPGFENGKPDVVDAFGKLWKFDTYMMSQDGKSHLPEYGFYTDGTVTLMVHLLDGDVVTPCTKEYKPIEDEVELKKIADYLGVEP